jgi:hypothetical protein
MQTGPASCVMHGNGQDQHSEMSDARAADLRSKGLHDPPYMLKFVEQL